MKLSNLLKSAVKGSKIVHEALSKRENSSLYDRDSTKQDDTNCNSSFSEGYSRGTSKINAYTFTEGKTEVISEMGSSGISKTVSCFTQSDDYTHSSSITTTESIGYSNDLSESVSHSDSISTSNNNETIMSENQQPRFTATQAIDYFNNRLNYYAKKYQPSSLLSKICEYAIKAGITSVYYALLLYYGLINEKIPMSKRILAAASLGYFISPLDLIPDILMWGLWDDGAVLSYAVTTLSEAIDEDTQILAKAKLCDWFGTDEIYNLPKIV